jgi:hypothetical protein
MNTPNGDAATNQSTALTGAPATVFQNIPLQASFHIHRLGHDHVHGVLGPPFARPPAKSPPGATIPAGRDL